VKLQQPTSEMFEQEIKLTNKETQANTLGNSPNSGNKWTQF